MNKTVREIFIGMLLGDGHIRRSGPNKAYIAFEQSTKKTEYLNYVKDILTKEGMELSDNRTYVCEDARHGSINSSLRFSTKASEDLKPLADLFLDDEGNKRIHPNIGEELTIRSLAHWIMDDGQQVKTGGVTLCTDNYKPEEVSTLRKVLQDNFGLLTSIHTKRNNDSTYERIYVKKESLGNIKESLQEHTHSSMLYKLNIDKSELEETRANINNKEENKKDTASDFSDTGSDLEID